MYTKEQKEQIAQLEQVEQLPDMSAAIASMGRGSMQRRIQQLELALASAELSLDIIAHDRSNACDLADKTLDRIAQILRG